jgi:hypothetical protein
MHVTLVQTLEINHGRIDEICFRAIELLQDRAPGFMVRDSLQTPAEEERCVADT